MIVPVYTATCTNGRTYDYVANSLYKAMRLHNLAYPELRDQVTQWHDETGPFGGTVIHSHDPNA
jgi:hypothetical protein